MHEVHFGADADALADDNLALSSTWSYPAASDHYFARGDWHIMSLDIPTSPELKVSKGDGQDALDWESIAYESPMDCTAAFNSLGNHLEK